MQSNAANENVFPFVSACVALKLLAKYSTDPLVRAYQPAVCVAVTEPAVMAVLVNFRPDVAPAAGPVMPPVLFAQANVEEASVNEVAC